MAQRLTDVTALSARDRLDSPIISNREIGIVLG